MYFCASLPGSLGFISSSVKAVVGEGETPEVGVGISSGVHKESSECITLVSIYCMYTRS